MSVSHHSPTQVISEDTNEFTQGRNHSSVDIVRKVSHPQVIARFMNVGTLEKDHTPVTSVGKASDIQDLTAYIISSTPKR